MSSFPPGPQGWLNDPELLLLASQDPAEVQHTIATLFKPHRLIIPDGTDRLDTCLHSIPLGQLSLNRLSYGNEVCIQPGRLDDFFLIQMPLKGAAQIHAGTQDFHSQGDRGVIISPTLPLDMIWSQDCDQIMLKIDRQKLEQSCSSYLGRPIKAPLVFDLCLSWQSDLCWHGMMQYFSQMVKQADYPALLKGQLEQLIIHTLLLTQPHNYSQDLNKASSVAPRHVKKVEDYIDAHAEQDISPAMLAELAGVSLRTLYSGFRSFRNITPMEHLRNVRLHRVRKELLEAATTRSITDIATYWGFGHMGRFSAEYKKLFGENPNETRRKA
ncbi:AraC family transcriptional regulator [Zobellella denitrificans]|uniref:AraC family transcriptional regulator n=1 Tax=Zobellella denitrificans TaxID=347534 RepID=UPI000BBE829B|nr:AraC family transcriptional regulator [Zobellella denitrificans]